MGTSCQAIVLVAVLEPRVHGAHEDAVLECVQSVEEFQARTEVSHVELAEIILDESGYTAMWQADKNPDSPGRLENLKELVKALENFDNLQGFLEHVSLVMDNDKQDAEQKVSIMTLHAAKGLEFPAVFLPGWEDGLFPSQRSMDESGLKGLEEERRLAYVGITRAQRELIFTYAKERRQFGEVARTSMVRHAFHVLTANEHPTRLLCFSDDMDGFRKVPENVPQQALLEKYIDQPLTSVPDPYEKFDSFGAHNNSRLKSFLDKYGFDYEFGYGLSYD